MVNITQQQHSKILGFALIAYGLQFLISIFIGIETFFIALFSDFASFLVSFPTLISWVMLKTIIYYLLLPVVGIISGIVIVSGKTSLLPLLFVAFFISFFPLGTILSFYVLWYLFVINENEISFEKTFPKKQNNE